MPIYEYACQSCGHVVDELQKMNEPPLVDCPECSKPELKKLVSAPNFRLKGKGWYETDFKDKNQRNLAGDSAPKPNKDDASKKEGKDAKGSSEGSAKDSTKSSKPAADKKAD